MDQPGATFSEGALKIDKRTLSIRIQRFENGFFVSVSEGGPKIGSLTVSLAGGVAGRMPVTTTIIPPRSQDSAFLARLVAEQVSSRAGGIALFSLSIREDLDGNDTKTLVSEIMEMVVGGNA